METNLEEWGKQVVTKAQAGDAMAVDEIMEHIMDTKGYVIWAISKKNTQHDRSHDDFRQEFMIGCYKAIKSANPERNPMGYIVQKGIWEMQSYLRSGYKKALLQHCNECHNTTRPLTQHGLVVCPKCNNSTIGTIDRFEFFTPVDYSDVESPYQHIPNPSVITEDDIIEEDLITLFEATLNGRVLDVFVLMIRKDINRQTSKNYIKEIAGELGITTSNVNLRLRAIKQKWTEFMEEIDNED